MTRSCRNLPIFWYSNQAFLRVKSPQTTRTIKEPPIASNQVESDQNELMPTLKITLPIQPPKIAPTTPRSNVASQPPPCSPGMIGG